MVFEEDLIIICFGCRRYLYMCEATRPINTNQLLLSYPSSYHTPVNIDIQASSAHLWINIINSSAVSP